MQNIWHEILRLAEKFKIYESAQSLKLQSIKAVAIETA